MSDIYERMQNVDRRVFYWILFISLMVPFLFPLSIPVKVNQNTRDLYEGVTTGINEGDVVIICVDYGVSAWGDCHPAVTVCAKALLRNGAKIIILSPVVDHELTYNKLLTTAAADFDAATYGEDWVNLGYYTGGETAVSQMAQDLRAIFPTDHFGTPLDDIPMMADINDYTGVKMVLSADTSDAGDYFLRQWQGPHGTLIAEIGIAMLGSTWMPYYLAGNAFGLSIGSRGGAELEVLIGEPGEATTSMDSLSVSHILIVLAVVLANVGIIAKLGRGES